MKKLLSIFRKDRKEPESIVIERPVITAFITMPDGSVEEMEQDTILQDGTCLISDGGKYYHTHVGCCYKWSNDVFDYFNGHGGWKLTTIEDAESQGLLPCLICDEEIREREKFWNELLGEDE